jgi:hypothetical protein
MVSRALEWGLPLALVVWLLVSQGTGYLGLPYWFSFGAPLVTLLGPWLIVSAWTSRSAGRPAAEGWVHATAALISIAALGLVAVALPLGLVSHVYVHAGLRVGLVVGCAVLLTAGSAAGWRLRRAPTAVETLIVLAVAAMIEADARILAFGALRDLGIYLRAGHAFLDQAPVYVMNTPADYVRDPTLSPFVYPPLTLPFFAALAALPSAVVKAGWALMCLGCCVVGLRLLGVRWRWVPVLLAWPPFVQGLYVGNAVLPTFLFFVAAPLLAWVLAFAPAFKFQLGLPGLWLVRERKWRDLAIAVAVGLGLIAVTLPLAGPDLWREWLRQLSDFSNYLQANDTIMGYSLQRFLGPIAMIGVAAAVAVLALLRRGGDSLAGLGIASMAASPTLYAHGATMGLPALLRLRAPLLWFALAMTSTVLSQQGYWIGLGLGFAALLLPALAHETSVDRIHHPLGALPRPWPSLADQPVDTQVDSTQAPALTTGDAPAR